MSTFKEHLKKYAERELELSGFDQTEFGKTTLRLLADLAELTQDDLETMKQLCALLPRLIDRNPLTAITEEDFEVETYSEGDHTVEILRCTRYPYVYKMNGKYYDDRAVAFRRVNSAESDRMYIYQTGNSSKQEITLPYFPNEELRVLQQEYTDLSSINPELDYEVE
jgi:hypothetical protein